MTATVERPPTVSRTRWYDPRTPWYARQRAANDWARANRPEDVTYEHRAFRRAQHTTEELAERVTQLLDDGMTADEIAAEIGLSLVTFETRFLDAGRRDLALPFIRARRAHRAANRRRSRRSSRRR